ncbi:MAG TPA: vanadium-dependent haloperoxidase, partial [Xanthomonadales bacterium]|nr:vanadium-dependent haloperoxidase [Xanthomonadales bacterium]
GPSYHPDGIKLYPGQIEVVTEETVAPGGIHNTIAGNMNQHVGKIAVHAWQGPDYIDDPDTDTAGVDWILCENWWPYQRPSFVTPPFAGYVSGHSTYSRAAAVIMSKFTGDEFFPGGVGTFEAPKNEFLVFEDGPSVDITLQWAKYADASDETSLSRIYGGIHPTADDIPGRFMGAEIGKDGFRYARQLFGLGVGSNMATFEVSKLFADSENPTGVNVTLNCFTGLPLQQTQTITQDQSVKFVVTDFEEEKLNCSVTEDSNGLYGYTASYLASGPGASNDGDGCHYAMVEDRAEFNCQITNSTDPVQLSIEKNWILDGSLGDAVDTYYKLTLFCDAEIVGGSDSCPYTGPALSAEQIDAGILLASYESCRVFSGHTDFIFIANVIPNWPSSNCQVIETIYDDGVEVDNGCEQLSFRPGKGASCTVTNTVFFEGIPALDRTGLAILVLLMLGLGLAGFRKLM